VRLYNEYCKNLNEYFEIEMKNNLENKYNSAQYRNEITHVKISDDNISKRPEVPKKETLLLQ